jgi:hypothetical protein
MSPLGVEAAFFLCLKLEEAGIGAVRGVEWVSVWLNESVRAALALWEGASRCSITDAPYMSDVHVCKWELQVQ